LARPRPIPTTPRAELRRLLDPVRDQAALPLRLGDAVLADRESE